MILNLLDEKWYYSIYLWLTSWQHPDHNTLWRFYKEHRAKMCHLFKLTVRTMVKMDLVDMAKQAMDGTKFQANDTVFYFRLLKYCGKSIKSQRNPA